MALCECGCGQVVGIARQTRAKYGHVKGQPFRFRGGHQRRLLPSRYRKAMQHPRRPGVIEVHRMRAECALGRPLKSSEHVHHADGTISADAPLVICENQRYHSLLHIRMQTVKAGGNPNTERQCTTCGLVKVFALFQKDPTNVIGVRAVCRACFNMRRRTRYIRKRR